MKRLLLVSFSMVALFWACQDVQEEYQPTQLAEEPAAATTEPGQNPAPEGVDPAALQAIPEPVKPAHLPMPESLELLDDHLFAMDTADEIYPLVFHGSRNYALEGHLTDAEGRREIILRNVREGTIEELVFPSGWLLPAVGAMNERGDILVCVNRLVGSPTTLTKGTMPDPMQGIDLVCRWRSKRGWSNEIKLLRKSAGQWLYDITARRSGSFWVSFSNDKSGLLVDDPEHGDGMYRVQFSRGRFEIPTVARRPQVIEP